MRNRLFASLLGFLFAAGPVSAQLPPPKPEKQLPPPTPEKPLPKAGKPAEKDTPVPAAAGPRLFGGGDWAPWAEGGIPWFSSEFLLWWIKEPKPIPPLITGPPLFDESGNIVGSSVLVGGASYDYDEFAGLRLRGGYWFDADRHVGVELSWLYLGKRSDEIRRNDLPILGRPFFDLNTGTESGLVIAQPGIAAGGFSFRTTSRTWGLETNLWKNLYYEPLFNCVRADLLCGFRYLDLAEDIRIDRVTSFNPDLTAFPSFLAFQSNQIRETESFRAHNHFYGPQAGVSFKVFGECLVLDVTTKVALGVNYETLNIVGAQQRIRPNGVVTVTPGALLALPSNSGEHSREQFGWVSEITVNMGMPLGNHVGVYMGYNFIYWSKVARPGDQIDRVVDSTQIPNFPPPIPGTTGQGRPSVPFTQSHWWTQGLNFGLEFSW